MKIVNIRSWHRWVWIPVLLSGYAGAQEITVTGRVAVDQSTKHARPNTAESAVVWLVPSAGLPDRSLPAAAVFPHPQLIQKNKSFEPHLLVVPVGSVVEFPNRDPFFHNVFSLFEGKRFDLGLYEAGSTKEVLFDKPGVSYIFCDIHSEMSAVIIALTTPYYGISDPRGQVSITHVPAGRYLLHVWDETALPEQLNEMTRESTVSESSANFGLLRVAATNRMLSHKNKYGLDYDPPTPDNPAYPHP